MSEGEWLIPSMLLTVGLGIAAVMLMSVAGYEEIPAYFSNFVTWMWYALTGGILVLIVRIRKLRIAGVDDPIRDLKVRFVEAKTTILAAIAGMMLAGIDMLFFMWIKPEITAIAPFWADKLLADIDHAIFGTDPWRLFEAVDLTFHAWAYSFFWAAAIVATLVWLFSQRPSPKRSVSLLSYFVLWSLFGPIGQYLLSAAGPVFYARIGLGDRFAELERNMPEVTQKVSGYLWEMHVNGELGIGAGISAMPSLHIATVTWIFLAFRSHRSRLAPLTAVFAIYIFALSVALGWHYAIDGFAGVMGALASQAACRFYVGRESDDDPSVVATFIYRAASIQRAPRPSG